MKKAIWFCFSLFLLFSCSTAVKKDIPDSKKIKQIKNTYWRSDKIEEKRTFKEGQYEFEAKINGESCATCIEKAQIGKIVLGNLSDLEDKNGVAIIYSETGGSGTFVYLNLYENKDGKMVQSGWPVFLGDRVVVKSLSIKDKKVKVDLITHGSGEPLCCPATKATRIFKVSNGQLKKIKK